MAKKGKQLAFFNDHDDQDAKDLKYGEQKESCKKLSKTKVEYVDPSYSGDWTPDED